VRRRDSIPPRCEWHLSRFCRKEVMNVNKVVQRIGALLPTGESVLAATKATPRGSVHEAILGAAGAVAGGQVTPGGAGRVRLLGRMSARQKVMRVAKSVMTRGSTLVVRLRYYSW